MAREGYAPYAHVHEIINGLKKLGWDVELYQPSYAKSQRQVSLLVKLLAYITVQLSLCWHHTRYDAVYIRAHPIGFPTSIFLWLWRVPVVVEINGPYDDLFVLIPWLHHFAPLLRFFMLLPYRLATCLIVVTNQLKSSIEQEIGHKCVVTIPAGANVDLFTPSAGTSRPLPERFVVFFGALAVWQGVDILLEALRHPRWPDDVALVVIGTGVERDKIEQSAKGDLAGKLEYLGTLPYKEIPGIVARSIAGLAPKLNLNNWEQSGLMPLKVFETAACGVPIIVTDFPGQADLVRRNNCGIVIPMSDAPALAEGVQYLASHAEESAEMGKRGRLAVEREHSWQQRAEETEQVLLNALKKNRS